MILKYNYSTVLICQKKDLIIQCYVRPFFHILMAYPSRQKLIVIGIPKFSKKAIFYPIIFLQTKVKILTF